jgi:protein-disulfide isomerase/uncharacterized membrane protein
MLCAAFLAASAGALALFMLVKAHALPGCGGGSGCEQVGATRWAWWGGSIPVAGLGVGAYLALFAAAVFSCLQRGRSVVRSLGIASLMVAGGALWFVALQVLVIKSICGYCMADHALGALAAATGVWAVTRLGSTRREWAVMSGTALLGIAVLVIGQVAFDAKMYGLVSGADLKGHISTTSLAASTTATPQTRPANSTEGAASTGAATSSTAPALAANTRHGPRNVDLLGGKLSLDPGDYPLLGAPEAPAVIVVLFDYTCPHCRRMHPMLLKALDRYGAGLAIVEFPVPLNTKCNPMIQQTDAHAEHACEYARLALAVWKADAAKFAAFDGWMFEGEQPPPVEEARKKAEQLVGAETLKEAAAHADVEGRLAVSLKVFDFVGGGAIPKMLTANRVIVGETDSAEQLYALLEKETGVKPAK